MTFQTQQGTREFVYATSWGLSTRMIGALIMAHGDDNGIVIPPKLATIQLAIVPIFRKPEERRAGHGGRQPDCARAARLPVSA